MAGTKTFKENLFDAFDLETTHYSEHFELVRDTMLWHNGILKMRIKCDRHYIADDGMTWTAPRDFPLNVFCKNKAVTVLSLVNVFFTLMDGSEHFKQVCSLLSENTTEVFFNHEGRENVYVCIKFDHIHEELSKLAEVISKIEEENTETHVGMNMTKFLSSGVLKEIRTLFDSFIE